MTCQRPHFSARLAGGAAALGVASLCSASASAQPAPYAPPYAPQTYGTPPYARPRTYGAPPGDASYIFYPPREDGFLADRARSWPIVRISQGIGLGFTRGRAATGYDLDLSVGYRWAGTRRWLLAIEGGYSYGSGPLTGGHFGSLGAGPELYIHRHVSLGWTPRVVVGDTWRGIGVGVRSTLGLSLFFHTFSIEAGSQWLHVGAGDQVELRAQLGVDLAALTYVLAYAVATSVP